MQLTLIQQTEAFLRAFLLGLLLCGVYIAFSVIRILLRHDRVPVLILDILFVCFCGIANFLFALSQTDGIIRGYSLFAEAAVFAAVYFTLGRLILAAVRICISAVSCCCRFVTAPVVCFTQKVTRQIPVASKKLLIKVKKNKK